MILVKVPKNNVKITNLYVLITKNTLLTYFLDANTTYHFDGRESIACRYFRQLAISQVYSLWGLLDRTETLINIWFYNSWNITLIHLKRTSGP